MTFSIPISGVRDSEVAHFVLQTGEAFRNVVSIHHGRNHTPYRDDKLRPVSERPRSPLCYNPLPRGKSTLANLSVILRQLKIERDRVQQQLSGLNAALEAFAGVYRSGPKPRRKMSSKGRARIAAAQRARWAKTKRQQKVVSIAHGRKPGKRTMSASARRKIAAAQRKRWAKLKRQKRNTGNDRATRL